MKPSKNAVAVLREPAPGMPATASSVKGAVGVVVGLEQVRRHGGGEHHRVQPVLAVAADVAGDLAAAHREADQGDVAQVEARSSRPARSSARVS